MNATQLAAVVRAAGVKRYWGDGPRPLNLPGAVANAQWSAPRVHEQLSTDGGSTWRTGSGTIVLEPTPAQLAAGIRVLEISPDEAYGSIATLHDAAVAAGWSAVIAQSRYLSEPATGGAVERRGRRLEKVVQSLRVARGPVRAYGLWEFDVERAKWSPIGGRVGIVTDDGMRGQVVINVTQLEKLIKNTEGSEK